MLKPTGEEIYNLVLCRDVAETGIKISVESARKDGQALSRDFLNDLESKLKLASRLKAERKSREAKKA